MKKSLYDILGVSAEAGADDIRLAFEQRSGQLGSADAGTRVALKEAYSVLSHAGRRAAYDASLLEAAKGAAARTEQAARQRALQDEPSSRRVPVLAGLGAVLLTGGWWLLHAGQPKDAQPTRGQPIVVRSAEVSVVQAPRVEPRPAAVPVPTSGGAALTAEQLFAQASPSIVRINVYDPAGRGVASGSGVVVDRDTVITNCHVVENGMAIKARQGSEQFDAAVELADETHDLCRLRVPGLNAPSVAMGSVASLSVGQKVYAIGSPQGLDLTLSDGLVSSLREGPDGTYIQTSAPVSPGSSGGGLFNEQGQLVGIVTFQSRQGQNLNFAIPVDWISRMSATRGERVYNGG